jgi:hypothetical protein
LQEVDIEDETSVVVGARNNHDQQPYRAKPFCFLSKDVFPQACRRHPTTTTNKRTDWIYKQQTLLLLTL